MAYNDNFARDRDGFRTMLTVSMLLLLGAGGRILLADISNFETILVMTFLGAMLVRREIALFLPLIAMVTSDLAMGNSILVDGRMNQIVLFTYSGFTAVALIGLLLRRPIMDRMQRGAVPTVSLCLGFGVTTVLMYDLWTNLGWWYLLYPHTAGALATVMALGVPFMAYHLLSALLTFSLIAAPVMVLTAHPAPERSVHGSHELLWKASLAAAVLVVVSPFLM